MIRIMVDSSADCRNDELYDFYVPIKVNIGGKEYLDGIDLDADAFYNFLTIDGIFPTTSQPSPKDFAEVFKKVQADGDELIYFALSSGLSGTYQSANIAKGMIGYDKIYIIDTRNVSHMSELLIKQASKLRAAGKTVAEIVESCESLKKRIKLLAGLDTLEYLEKGGRIGKATAFVGSLAKVKPLITLSPEGTVDVAGKALGLNRAIQLISDRVKTYEIDKNYPVCSLYTCGEENCEKLEEKLKSDGLKISERLQVGATIGAHVGPGLYGLFFVEK